MSTNRIGFSNDFVLKNEKIGMGTADPLQILHVQGNLLVALGTDTTKHITLNPYETNNGTLSWEGSAGQLFSITNNLTEGSIFSVNDVSGIPSIDVDADGTISLAPFGGNVGIGTTSPAGTLDVGAVSGAVTTGDLTVTTGSTTAKVTIGRLSGITNDNTTFRIRDRVNRDVLTVDLDNFVYSQAAGERARIDSSGRLGLGTSSPQELLDVAGNGNSYLRWEGAGNLGSYSTSGGVLRIGPYYDATDRELALYGDNSSTFWVTTGTTNALNIGTNKTSQIHLKPNGRVGVGTTSPAVDFDVAGTIRASTGILFGSDTANANALDDYEEGTWTPSGISAVGRYTKVGNLVTLYLAADQNNNNNNTNPITGLPFVGAYPAGNIAGTGRYYALSTNGTTEMATGAALVRSGNLYLMPLITTLPAGAGTRWFSVTVTYTVGY